MAIDQILHAYVASEETYSDKQIIIREGTQKNWVYVILEGRIKIQKKTPKGRVTLATLKEGAVLGELAFLSGVEEIHSVTATATDGPVKVGILDSERLLRDYEMIPPRLKDLIKLIIKRLRTANDRVCELLTSTHA